MRLRSRGDSPGRFQTSPKRTLSVYSPSAGAMSAYGLRVGSLAISVSPSSFVQRGQAQESGAGTCRVGVEGGWAGEMNSPVPAEERLTRKPGDPERANSEASTNRAGGG